MSPHASHETIIEAIVTLFLLIERRSVMRYEIELQRRITIHRGSCPPDPVNLPCETRFNTSDSQNKWVRNPTKS